MRPGADGCMHPSERRAIARTIPGGSYKPTMSESIEQISFRLTSSELAEQERSVAALRSCAGTILAAASVAGSFLAAAAHRGSLSFCNVTAMGCFALCAVSAISVLLPHRFVFAFRGAALLRSGVDRSGSHAYESETYRAAGMWIEPQIQANRKRITALEELVAASCVLLAVEVMLWTIAVAS